jgi:TfoX/Sxy family transcriptional regulator of competence genes
MTNSISLKNPIAVVYESRIAYRTVYATEIRVLRSGKPAAVYNKEGERYKFEYLDLESQERVKEIVERNKKYL